MDQKEKDWLERKNKDQKERRQAIASAEQKRFSDWETKWLAKGYFDWQNPTVEQEDDWVKGTPKMQEIRAKIRAGAMPKVYPGTD